MNKSIKKIISLGLNRIKGKILTKLSMATKKNFTLPVQVYWTMFNRCNFRCKMCPQWHRGETENRSEYCNLAEMKKVVDEMAELGIKSLGLSGGEPLMDQELLFGVLEYANSKGIYTHFGSNGWLLSEKVLRRYDEIGGGHISLSVDGIGSTHDEIRAFPGSFNKIISVLEMYIQLKLKNVSIKMNTVFSGQNYEQILEIIALAKKYDVAIFLQPFDNFDYDKINESSSLVDNSFNVQKNKVERIREIVAEIIETKKKDKGLILNSFEHLKNIPDYFSNRFRINGKCEVFYKNMNIDPFGNVIPCGYLGPIGNIKKDSIYDIWNSLKAKQARIKSQNCKQNCMQGCFFDPKIGELIRSGIYYIAKLLKK